MKSLDTIQIIGVVFGFNLGFGSVVISHAFRQAQKFNWFAVLVWSEIAANLLSASLVYLHLSGVVGQSFPVFFGIIALWAAQVHFILQIVVNRISLIWSNPKHIRWLRWGIFLWVCLIEISVLCIWLPARMQVSATFVRVNNIWDRLEKVLCLLTDGALNYTFIYGIKKNLIAAGLTKYDKLVKFNARIMILSLGLDLLIIGMMFLRDSLLYAPFHPLAAMIKLGTELQMSRLLVKVVKAQQELRAITRTDCEGACGTDPQTIEVVTTQKQSLYGDEELNGQFGSNLLSPMRLAHQHQPQLQIRPTVSPVRRFRPDF